MGFERPTTILFTTLLLTAILTSVASLTAGVGGASPNFRDIVQPYVEQGRFPGANGVMVQLPQHAPDETAFENCLRLTDAANRHCDMRK
jgi:hypothetical protein